MDLSCQGIKLISTRPRFAAFHSPLTFADHVHEFNATQDMPSGTKGLEVEHGPSTALDRPMVLLDDVVEVFDLTDHNLL